MSHLSYPNLLTSLATRSGSQSQPEIRLILPAHGPSHIISNRNLVLFFIDPGTCNQGGCRLPSLHQSRQQT